MWEGKNGEGAGLIWVRDCSDLMALLCRRGTEMALLHRRAMWPCYSGPLRWSCYTRGPGGLVIENGL